MKLFIADEFFLVYWQHEEGVSVVPKKDIVTDESAVLDVGSVCKVRLGKEVYAGKVAAVGK